MTAEYKLSDVDRFVDKIAFPTGGADNTDDCWFWTGAKHSKERGYGKFWLGGRAVNAHKAAYLLFRGDVEEGKVLGHKCNCESCANPWHVEPQSQSQNMQYCVQSGRHNSRSNN